MLMKKVISVFSILIICVFINLNSLAVTNPHNISKESLNISGKLTDNANLLTKSEREKLTEQLNEISSRQNFDVNILTVNGMPNGYNSIMDFADDVYDYCDMGYGVDHDGCLLVVDMKTRKWHISTAGFGITALTDAGLEYIEKQFKPYLSDKKYYKSFSTFASLCDDFVTQAKTGSPYDRGNLPKNINYPIWILSSLGIGLIGAFIITERLRSKMKSVKNKLEANEYIVENSMKINNSKDTYLYSTVNRVRRAETKTGSSTHTSSSGTSHGGRGGSF